jgi:hypothetical protein
MQRPWRKPLMAQFCARDAPPFAEERWIHAASSPEWHFLRYPANTRTGIVSCPTLSLVEQLLSWSRRMWKSTLTLTFRSSVSPTQA